MSFQTWLAGRILGRFKTARDIVRFALRFYGSRIALIDRRGAFTFRQIGQRALQLSAAMEANGVRKGDIVFTWLPETGEQFELRLATFENGAVAAMFHQFLSPQAALTSLRTLRPKLFVHDAAMSRDMIDAVHAEFPDLLTIAIGVEYENFIASHAPTRSETELGSKDLASLHLTSGTTGQPKAIGVTHGKYLMQLRMMAQDIGVSGAGKRRKGPDVIMLGLPLTGPGGGLVLPSVLAGAALVVPPNFDIPALMALVRRWRVTRAFLSPSSVIDLLDDPQCDLYDVSSLGNIIYGSEMMPAAKIAEAVRRFGPIFQQGYGSFEALPPLTWLRPADHVGPDGAVASVEVLGSVGTVATGVGICVVNDEKRRRKSGVIGHIMVKTPLAFSGYWGRPDLDDATLYRGWVVTGDMGYFDAQNRLHVLGRGADTVRRRGQEIYPRQVEEVAHAHEAVRDACLVQANDEAHLVVTVRHHRRKVLDKEVLARELQRHLDSHLPPELSPDRIHVVDSIPRSFLNKMLRREVRDQLWHSVSTREASGGFTLIELVMVIVILSVLAAVALPKFVNLGADARIAALNGLAGGLQTAISLAQAKCSVAPSCNMQVPYSNSPTPSVTVNGQPHYLHYGYPTAWGSPGLNQQGDISYWLQSYAGFTRGTYVSGTGLLDFTKDGAPDPLNCRVRYQILNPTNPATVAATVTVRTSGC